MALIKCPECNKEISDTVKSCLHCGFKIKKDNQLSKKQKKLMIILIISIVSFIALASLGIVIFLVVTKDTREINKMAKYLESVGYTCTNNSDYKGAKDCVRNRGNKKETMEIHHLKGTTYTVVSKGEYEMSISAHNYYYGYSPNGKFITATNLYREEYTCWYVPSTYDDEYYLFGEDYRWEIGDTSIGYGEKLEGAFGTTNCQYDYSDKVDAMLREFEGYYQAIGYRLGE